MKNILTILIAFFISSFVYSQSECKVLIENLKGEYTGKCKKGLAQGKGEAKGTDHYVGKFKKGYPHGKGTYTFENGNMYVGFFKNGERHGEGKLTFKFEGRDSIQEGIFENNIYKGPKPLPDYKIVKSLNTIRIQVIKINSDPNVSQVSLKILRDGNRAPFSNLNIDNSSGQNSESSGWQIIRNFQTPLKIRATYRVTGRMGRSITDCDVQVIINNPGTYEIVITN